MTATDKVEVYRLKLRRGTGSSFPDWKLYESKEEFDRDLLDALIEEAANYRNRSPFVAACSQWIKQMFPWRDDYRYSPISTVVGAERLIDGEWVALKPRLLPPRLEFDD